MKYYVAYGSNLNVRQMKNRCPGAVAVGTAEIPNYRLLYKGSMTGAYLTIEKAKGFSVPVAVWKISSQDEASLDRYEGYPTFYYKKDMVLEVNFFDREPEFAVCFVYIMHEYRPFGIPTDYYVATCKEGYKNFFFNPGALTEALKESRQQVEKMEKKPKLDDKVKKQIFAIRETGRTNMFDTNQVQDLALEYGLFELYNYIERCRGEYFSFILYGK